MKNAIVPVARMECPSIEAVKDWFDDALKSHDPKPSYAQCEKLALDLFALAVKTNNELFEKALQKEPAMPFDPLSSGFRNLSVNDYERIRFARFCSAVRALRAEITLLGELSETPFLCPTRGVNGTITPSEISELLLFIGVLAPPVEGKQRGAPRVTWHAAGREIVHLVKNLLMELDYKGSKRETDSNGVVAHVGASAVRHLFGGRMPTQAAFAWAMKDRNRSKGRSTEPLFPHADRLKA